MIFKKFWGRQEPNPVPTGPDVLWAYPLYRFANKEEPFKSWQPPEIKIRPDMYDLCLCAAVGYMFYYYYVLLYKHYGSEVASIVRSEHVSGLNRVTSGFGDQLAGILETIENGQKSAARTPFTLPSTGQEMPDEVYIANHFLFSIRESPYYDKLSALTERDGLPTMDVHEAMFDVAECLVWNRDRAINHFTEFFDVITLDARTLKGWVDEKMQAQA